MTLTFDKRLLDLKDKYNGETCFLVGNGPSVNDIDFSKIKDKYIFVCNDFHMHPIWKDLTNVFFSEANQASYISGRFNQWKLNRLLQNKKALYFYRSTFRLLNEIEEYLPLGRTFYINWNNNRKIYEGDFEWDITKEVTFGNSVVITFSFALAQWMGFKNMYLIGCDCTSYDSDAYFYNCTNIPKQFQPRTYDTPDMKNMIESWRHLSTIINKKNIKIYNLSKKSNLDMFPKVGFDTLNLKSI